jgi:hypothetical protein
MWNSLRVQWWLKSSVSCTGGADTADITQRSQVVKAPVLGRTGMSWTRSCPGAWGPGARCVPPAPPHESAPPPPAAHPGDAGQQQRGGGTACRGGGGQTVGCHPAGDAKRPPRGGPPREARARLLTQGQPQVEHRKHRVGMPAAQRIRAHGHHALMQGGRLLELAGVVHPARRERAPWAPRAPVAPHRRIWHACTHMDRAEMSDRQDRSSSTRGPCKCA